MTEPSNSSVEYYKFILFIANDEPNSMQAKANVQQICETYLRGRYEIQVVDVLQDQQLAQDYGILVTPALVRIAPQPKAMLIGKLSDIPAVLRAMGLTGIG